MEVVDSCSALLSDREVLELLRNNTSKKQANLATILYETTSYLDSSPAATCSLADLAEFLSVLKQRKYELSRLEKIQLANQKPQNEIELHLIVDNIEERFSEEQRDDLLAIVQSILHRPSCEPGESLRKRARQ